MTCDDLPLLRGVLDTSFLNSTEVFLIGKTLVPLLSAKVNSQ